METGQRPSVIAVYPADNQSGVPLDVTIQARFSADMDASSINAATFHIVKVFGGSLVQAAPPVYKDRYAFLKPLEPLEPSTAYRAVIVGDAMVAGAGTLGVRDVLGNYLLGVYEWSFTTASVPAVEPPRLLSPAEGAVLEVAPRFEWDSSAVCELQLAFDAAFSRVVYSTTAVSGVVLQADLADGTYYWRVRLAVPGARWSEPHRFSIVRAVSYEPAPEAPAISIISPNAEWFPLATNELVVRVPGIGHNISAENVRLVGRAVLPGLESHGEVPVRVESTEVDGDTILRVKF